MPVQNGKIIAPISVSDVRSILGVSSTDVGTLCTSSNINKWARYKPVKYRAINTVNVTNWFKAENGDCGLTPFDLGNFNSVKTKLDASNGDWTYERPTGGTAYPYRLTDFKGYKHRCLPPIYLWTSTIPGVDLLASNGVTFEIEINDDPTDIEYELQFSDFDTSTAGHKLQDMYFFVMLYLNGTLQLGGRIKCSYPISNATQGRSIFIEKNRLTGGVTWSGSKDYQVYYGLCNSAEDVLISIPPYDVDLNPITWPLTLSVKHSATSIYAANSYIGYSLTGTFIEDTEMMQDDGMTAKHTLHINPLKDDNCYVKFIVKNTTTSSRTFIRTMLYGVCRYGSKGGSQLEIDYLCLSSATGTNLTQFTVNANSEVTVIARIKHGWSNGSNSINDMLNSTETCWVQVVDGNSGFVFLNTLTFMTRFDQSYNGNGEFI